MKILFNILKDFKEWESDIKKLKNDFPDAKIEVVRGLSELEIIDHEVIVSTRFTEDDLDKARNLKLIIAPKSGLEKWPLDSLNKKKIKVLNSNANSKYVAERAIGMSLSLLGKISEFDSDLRRGEWFNWGGDYKWSSISQLKCGIIGYGSIGKRIHRVLDSFGCETLIYTRSKKLESLQYVTDLREFLMQSEMIFICVPHTSETDDMINDSFINELKNKYLINISRASIVNEKFLFKLLNKNILRGAAIDVWYNNPDKLKKNKCFPSKYPFHQLNNLIMSPHAGSHAVGSSQALIEDSMSQLRKYLENII